ncbi:MAG TPA: aminotransferase class V-fold PLP-dependent enzyme [Candidatus Polarisedimenticolaceae bacterium]|nr:aminotransferase class V-fold PLP-dependent enzyme [Candidatus Polarisedimenticolaceae bacterium]
MSGRPFLQIPGPSIVPERVIRAMCQPLIDHRGPQFAVLLSEVLEGLKKLFQTVQGKILLFPGSGTGGWESCIVNTLSPGDQVLGCVNGHFSDLYCRTATAHGVKVQRLEVDYGAGVPAGSIEECLRLDKEHQIKAVLFVQTETSTGVTSSVAAVRDAIDNVGHPALLLADVVSSLGCTDLRFDEWRLDVALTAAQKGLMLPPGMAILAVSEKALQANRSAKCARSFWDWQAVLESNANGNFPYTPATSLILGLSESLKMLFEEGLESVFRRHARLAEACRRAIEATGLRLFPQTAAEYSNTLTAVRMPEGVDSDAFIDHTLKLVDLPLGKGLGKVKGKLFRIGHLGSLNELELLGILAGLEMALKSFGVKIELGAGLAAAETYLLENSVRRSPL